MASNCQRLVLLVTALSILVLVPSPASFAAEKQAERKLVVEDLLGRKVTVPANPRRIIALAAALRMVVYLEAFDRVVGVEGLEKENPPQVGRPYGMATHSKSASLPDVGEGGLKPVNIEKIIALRPDLIVTGGFDRFQADSMARKTGIPVLALSYGGIGIVSENQAVRSLELLGRVLGKEQRARQLTKFIADTRSDLARRSRSRKKRGPTVYVGCIGYKGMHGITSTDANFYPLDAIGADNVAKGLRAGGHLFIDREQILVWNPDVILVDVAGMPLLRKDYAARPAFYLKLKAVREGRVFQVMPYNNYYTNIETALADAYAAGAWLYPERFAGIDPDRKADEIIRLFTGAPVYEPMKRHYGGFRRLEFTRSGIHVR